MGGGGVSLKLKVLVKQIFNHREMVLVIFIDNLKHDLKQGTFVAGR